MMVRECDKVARRCVLVCCTSVQCTCANTSRRRSAEKGPPPLYWPNTDVGLMKEVVCMTKSGTTAFNGIVILKIIAETNQVVQDS